MRKRILAALLTAALLLCLTACGAPAPAVCEVRFELNGGTLVSGQLLQHIEAGGAAVPPEVEREGYAFAGWSEDLDTISANTVAAALWTRAEAAPAVYEVRFELNGGTLVSGQLLQRIEEGGFAVPPEVEREGYVFAGWSEELDAISANTVAAALWTRAEAAPAVYEVRFELNGGTLVSGHLLQRIEEGGSAMPPEVEREGYAFVGWSEKLDAISADTVAAALWESYCQVSFDAAGGEIVSGEAEQLIRRGDTPEAPRVERAYYDFDGWSPALGAVDKDCSFTALWTARKLSSEEIFDKISPAVVEITAYEPSGTSYLGSGFFIDDAGRFVTNYHVIDGTDRGEIALPDGSTCPIVAVLAYDKALDLAVLQADVHGNAYLAISEQSVSTGESVYALGSSQGLTSTFSSGIVSTASREIDGVHYIQTTAPISHGNSGGPLVDPYGEVVGVNSMTLVSGQNLNFAIDIHELDRLESGQSLTLAEVCAAEYPGGAPDTSEDAGFYEEADAAEKEANDTFLLSDRMENGAWIAGEISGVGDMDWFFFELDEACDVNFEVLPYYSDDFDYLLCGILSLNDSDDDVDLIDALSPTELDGYDAFTGTVHFDAPGSYFLLLFVDETYPFDEPSYYAARASW